MAVHFLLIIAQMMQVMMHPYIKIMQKIVTLSSCSSCTTTDLQYYDFDCYPNTFQLYQPNAGMSHGNVFFFPCSRTEVTMPGQLVQ